MKSLQYFIANEGKHFSTAIIFQLNKAQQKSESKRLGLKNAWKIDRKPHK